MNKRRTTEEDPPEFIDRCCHCPLPRCNVGGGENMERCIMRNGLNFETPRRQYNLKPREEKFPDSYGMMPRAHMKQTGI